MIEIVLAARFDPELSRICIPIVEDARLVLNSIWIDTLSNADTRKSAQQFIELTHYLLRHFLVSAVAIRRRRRAAIDAWRQLAPAACV